MSSAEVVMRILWAIQFVILTATAISSLIFVSLRNRQMTILWLATGCYTVVHMLFYVMPRYREPIMPLLGVIAALTLETFYKRRHHRDHILFSSKPKNT